MTDSLLTERECERCHYTIPAGAEHEERPQPPGSNVVVCGLRFVPTIGHFGFCSVCGDPASETLRVEGGGPIEGSARHHRAYDHDPVVVSGPLVEVLDAYLTMTTGRSGPEGPAVTDRRTP